MDHLPKDPAILVSSVNMLLRDGEYDSLEEICNCFNSPYESIAKLLHDNGYTYCESQKQIRPIGFDEA
jgi:hypothetical protein